MKSKNLLLWACRIIAALIMLQTLYYKLTAASESVYIFTQVGMEPEGRIATAIVELLAAILLLIQRAALVGAVLMLIIMIVAIDTHVGILGIEVMNDGGQLFIYAIIVALCCFYIILRTTKRRKKEVP